MRINDHDCTGAYCIGKRGVSGGLLHWYCGVEHARANRRHRLRPYCIGTVVWNTLEPTVDTGCVDGSIPMIWYGNGLMYDGMVIVSYGVA